MPPKAGVNLQKLQDCRLCPRLAQHLENVRAKHPAYYALPVPPFGDEAARLFIVGLAPGLHGANATGRPFTGDYAGILLYRTLHEYGFANQALSTARNDGLVLYNCRISNAVKCLPPENKPQTAEVNTCNVYLQEELKQLAAGTVILALGGIAHRAVLKALGLKQRDCPFTHGAQYGLTDGRYLLSSYHCSRYNTQTKRLTEAMFKNIFATARDLVG